MPLSISHAIAMTSDASKLAAKTDGNNTGSNQPAPNATDGSPFAVLLAQHAQKTAQADKPTSKTDSGDADARPKEGKKEASEPGANKSDSTSGKAAILARADQALTDKASGSPPGNNPPGNAATGNENSADGEIADGSIASANSDAAGVQARSQTSLVQDSATGDAADASSAANSAAGTTQMAGAADGAPSKAGRMAKKDSKVGDSADNAAQPDAPTPPVTASAPPLPNPAVVQAAPPGQTPTQLQAGAPQNTVTAGPASIGAANSAKPGSSATGGSRPRPDSQTAGAAADGDDDMDAPSAAGVKPAGQTATPSPVVAALKAARGGKPDAGPTAAPASLGQVAAAADTNVNGTPAAATLSAPLVAIPAAASADSNATAMMGIASAAPLQAQSISHVGTSVQLTPTTAEAAPNVNSLAVEIAVKSQSGARQFDIRLDPPELGRVDIRLSIDASGAARAHMTADQPQTLHLLQKDSQSLTQALRDAGLNVSQDGLNFSLKGQGRQGQNNGDGGAQPRTPAATLTATKTIDSAASIAAFRNTGTGDARLDIHV